ncbi:MAG: DUF3047 domain-containing protein [Cellvibrionaceae bacterium]
MFAVAAVAGNAQPAELRVGEFSEGRLADWDTEEFEGETEYRIVEEDGRRVLQAVSRASASGLGKEQRIDLQAYPYLNWSWKIDKRLPPRDESTKAGDDYPARIYLVVSGGWRFWRTKAVNYVWARNMEKGASWPNAFAENNVLMIAIRDGDDGTGTWYNEKRNVLKDLQQFVDPDIRYIDGIAIMTDTDNTESSATSFYGDIFFTSQ